MGSVRASWLQLARAAATPLFLASAILGFLSCQSEADLRPVGSRTQQLLPRAQEFRSLIERGDFVAARAFMAENPRRWWESRDGDGQPWKIGPEANGPWSAWDAHFRSQKDLAEWREATRSVTVVVHETNDYFRLLERGWVTTEVTYFFDEAGKIEGLLIRATGDRPQGRTDEFLAWARTHDAEELGSLMPGGEIDPSADHPERFRRLLNRWREAAGLESIEEP
jgi:hypothetical protein